MPLAKPYATARQRARRLRRMTCSRARRCSGGDMSKRVILAAVLAAWSAGCLGTGGVTSKARELNLRAVENRWAREGLYLGMQALWIYRICSVLDLFVFNSIEFWSGTNPINGKRALAEVPRSQVEKM